MTPQELLYAWLPAVYRRRDAELGRDLEARRQATQPGSPSDDEARLRKAEQGGPLRALLAIIDEQLRDVQADIETTWDNAFVETAEEWLVPYLGAALGLPVTRNVEAVAFSRRAFVANTLRYRRGKGTAATVELVARDVTNYPARVVEFFTRVAWNEAVNHQARRSATLDLRDALALERLAGPFGEATRTAEVRRITSGRGTANLPNLGLFMWRTQLWPVSGVNARRITSAPTGAWSFQSDAGERPLYAALETEVDPAAVATESSVPLPLSRRRLWSQSRRLGEEMSWPFTITVYGDGAEGREARPVPAARIRICNLETFPAATPADRVTVDPERGVLVLGADFAAGLTDMEVVTDHFIATPGGVGAGPWDRDQRVQAWLASWTLPPEARTIGYQVVVQREGNGPGIVSGLAEAVLGWHAHLAALPDDASRSRALGLILVGDSRTHAVPSDAISVPEGAVLGIVAVRWPETADPARGPGLVRRPGDLVADGVRPVVSGDLRFEGQSLGTSIRGEICLDGLTVDGAIRAGAGPLHALRLASTTVSGAVVVDAIAGRNAALVLGVTRCVLGDVTADGPMASVSLVDAAVTGAVRVRHTPVDVRGTTVLGTVQAGRLSATDSIFDSAIDVEQQQDGCVRFCYVAPDSRTPRRFRCQPDLAIDEAGANPTAASLARLRVRPQFVSRDPRAPGFLLLAPATPAAVAGAAEDGGEPGSWHHLQHGIRQANLVNALPQFLRFGLEPGLFFLA